MNDEGPDIERHPAFVAGALYKVRLWLLLAGICLFITATYFWLSGE